MEKVDPTATTREVTGDLAAGADPLGSTLGRYTIFERVGAGGMGVVFRARDPALARELAIKVVRAEGGADAQVRTMREAQAMARLRHPAVVPVFDVGLLSGGVFIVMPYLRGGSLAQWLREAPRPWREVLDRFVAAGHGLAVAHAAGLVHRDFKPDNVLLDEDGAPVVADFGLARPAQAGAEGAGVGHAAAAVDVTRTGAMAGTIAYMAPEQLRGEDVDARADLFGFCVSLHEGLYGERPFGGDDGDDRFAAQLGAIVARRLRAPPADRKVPGWLRAAVLRGLEHDPAARWPSMDALLAHLERRRRRPRRVIAAAILAVAAAGLLAFVLAGRRHADPAPRAYQKTRLTSRGDIDGAALAPDGHHLAMISVGGELIVRDLDSAGDERLVASNALVPAWSADGGRLAYIQRTGEVRVVELATGADTGVGRDAGLVAFVGPRLLVSWAINHRDLSFVDLGRPDAPRWSCTIPGTYRWLNVVVPRSDGTLFVGTAATDAPGVAADRVVQVDTRCAVRGVVADHLVLADVAKVAHDDRLVARTAGASSHLIEIDRDGDTRRVDAPIPDRQHKLVGIRPDGSILDFESEATWRLVRAGPDHAPIEVAAGSLHVVIAVAPRGDRFGVLETNYDGAGGALRVVELAAAAARGAPIETRAVALGWTDDGALVALLARGDATILAVEDPRGGHRVEHVVPRPALDGAIVSIGAGEVAYVRDDSRTFVAVDLRTGATRPLFDPGLGFTHALSRSPRDGSLLLWWMRKPRTGIYRVPASGDAEWLAPSLDATPLWSHAGDAIFVVTSAPPRIDRLDPATGATTAYVTDLGSRSSIVDVALAPAPDLFVHLSDPNSDVFALTPIR